MSSLSIGQWAIVYLKLLVQFSHREGQEFGAFEKRDLKVIV